MDEHEHDGREADFQRLLALDDLNSEIRDVSEIVDAIDEVCDLLWYTRHVALGEPVAGREAAARIRKQHGDVIHADPVELSWKLVTLRWVLGSAWDEPGILDTWPIGSRSTSWRTSRASPAATRRSTADRPARHRPGARRPARLEAGDGT